MIFEFGTRQVVYSHHAPLDYNLFMEKTSGIRARVTSSYLEARGLTPEAFASRLARRADQLAVTFPQKQDAPRRIMRGQWAGYYVDDAYGF